MTPGRPAAVSPASLVRPAYASSRSRSSPRACSSVAASPWSSGLPSLARARARRSAVSDGVDSRVSEGRAPGPRASGLIPSPYVGPTERAAGHLTIAPWTRPGLGSSLADPEPWPQPIGRPRRLSPQRWLGSHNRGGVMSPAAVHDGSSEVAPVQQRRRRGDKRIRGMSLAAAMAAVAAVAVIAVIALSGAGGREQARAFHMRFGGHVLVVRDLLTAQKAAQ